MRDAALALCASMEARRPARWLSLLGPSGIGKTMLARAVMEFVKRQASFYRITGPGGHVAQQHRFVWVNWRLTCKEMRRGDFSVSEELCIPQRDRDYAIWFAVIDDIGAGDEQDRSYLRNTLETIVDARLGAWTIFTSNLLLDQISEQLDRRIASRMLRDGNVVVEAPTLPDWNVL
jgi:DNA replication protein DnaC